MEMESNAIMGEPAENTADEGQAETAPDIVWTETWELIAIWNAVATEPK